LQQKDIEFGVLFGIIFSRKSGSQQDLPTSSKVDQLRLLSSIFQPETATDIIINIIINISWWFQPGNISQNWIMFPSRGENKQCLKAPPSHDHHHHLKSPGLRHTAY